jgi:hypothetical protein
MNRTLRKHRERERGAAMVEAAFMFPLFIILFFSLMYAHSYTATKIDEETQGREMAWTNAMSNCGTTGDSETEQLPDNVTSLSLTHGSFVATNQSSSIVMTTTSNPQQPMNGESNSTQSGVSQAIAGGSVEGAFSGLLGMILGAVSDLFPDPNGAQGVSKTAISWRMPNNYNGSDPSNSTTLTQTVTVMCNEKPQNGTVLTVIEDFFGDVMSFVTQKL